MHRLDTMQAAGNAVAIAIKQGELIRASLAPSVEIQALKVIHPNYDFPLSGEWLCPRHHCQHHAKLPSLEQRAKAAWAIDHRLPE
jgi:hypothetical protein